MLTHTSRRSHVPGNRVVPSRWQATWLCRTFDVRLWCGAGDADAMSSGRVDTYRCAPFNRLQRTLLPVARASGRPRSA